MFYTHGQNGYPPFISHNIGTHRLKYINIFGGVEMRKLVTICAVVTMMLAVSGAAQAVPLHQEGFENDLGDWTSYNSPLTRVYQGSTGIPPASGDYHVELGDPAPGDGSGAYSYLGGARDNFGSGWSSSIDIYIDLDDSEIAAGTYGFVLSQAINNAAGTAGEEDNIFHVGARDLEPDGSYELYVNASHGTGGGYDHVLDPPGYHGGDNSPGQFTQSGWYTFGWNFEPSTERTDYDFVYVTWSVVDAADNELWSQSWTTEGYEIQDVGKNRYMWFVEAEADRLAIDNVTMIPEPATLCLLGLGSLLLRRKKSA